MAAVKTPVAVPKELRVTLVNEVVGIKVETPLGLILEVKYESPEDTYPEEVNHRFATGKPNYICSGASDLLSEALDLEEKYFEDLVAAIRAVKNARKKK